MFSFIPLGSRCRACQEPCPDGLYQCGESAQSHPGVLGGVEYGEPGRDCTVIHCKANLDCTCTAHDICTLSHDAHSLNVHYCTFIRCLHFVVEIPPRKEEKIRPFNFNTTYCIQKSNTIAQICFFHHHGCSCTCTLTCMHTYMVCICCSTSC